jgi:DsbC/DsbD-like thiol-disulfide interchange protein
MKNIGRTLSAAAAAGSIAMMVAALAHADDASPWSEDTRSAIRLIAGSNKSATPLRAGVELRLQPGWKTYWRYPGDSGVPPRFDFSGSDNLKSAMVLYPAPHLFSDEAGNSLGYKDSVTFPVQVTPKQVGKPVTLHLKFDYAVCEKLCVPAQGSAALALATGNSAQDTTLRDAEAQVPQKVSAAQAGLTVRRINNTGKPLVMVDLKAPPGAPVDIFVEGPTPEWALPIPKPAPDAPGGHRQFGFELDGLPPGVDPKGQFDLTFTVVESGRAIEVVTHLD